MPQRRNVVIGIGQKYWIPLFLFHNFDANKMNEILSSKIWTEKLKITSRVQLENLISFVRGIEISDIPALKYEWSIIVSQINVKFPNKFEKLNEQYDLLEGQNKEKQQQQQQQQQTNNEQQQNKKGSKLLSSPKISNQNYNLKNMKTNGSLKIMPVNGQQTMINTSNVENKTSPALKPAQTFVLSPENIEQLKFQGKKLCFNPGTLCVFGVSSVIPLHNCSISPLYHIFF